jgi:hypothetical protein
MNSGQWDANIPSRVNQRLEPVVGYHPGRPWSLLASTAACVSLQSTAFDATTTKPATQSNATVAPERQRLMDLVGEDLQMAVLVDKILRGSAPRAAAISVGITSKQFTNRMESDPKFRDLVLQAAHQAEGSVSENLYRAATGNSPQNVQAAIAWLEKRHPELWGRETQRIELEVSGGVDVNHILSDPRLIEEVSRHEALMQQIEDGVIEGEFRQLPAVGVTYSSAGRLLGVGSPDR